MSSKIKLILERSTASEASEDDSNSNSFLNPLNFKISNGSEDTCESIINRGTLGSGKDFSIYSEKSIGTRDETILNKEKSLGILAFNFVSVIQREKLIAIERAAELLSQNMESNKFKTKIRRLYDVSKVLMTIGLIRQVHLNEHKRSALEWIGPDNMKETITNMLQEPLKEPNFHNYASYQNTYQTTANSYANVWNYLFEGGVPTVAVATPKGCRSDSFTQGVTPTGFSGMLGKREFMFPARKEVEEEQDLTITKFLRVNSNVVCPRVSPINHY